MKNVTLTTGSAISNGEPLRGGWAYILRYGSHSTEDSGSSGMRNDVRMELQAAVEGLRKLKVPCEVLLISDYTELLEGIEHDRFIWKANGWRDRWDYHLPELQELEPYPIRDADLWQRLDAAAERHIIHTQYTGTRPGHPDLVYSDVVRSDLLRCDQLASSQVWANISGNTPTTI